MTSARFLALAIKYIFLVSEFIVDYSQFASSNFTFLPISLEFHART